ncbi:AfsR/SARP family transcriptional regulator [Actinoplanes derwentensis]|uniref:AfsR/SARP family transcriptional regulator n=1 Tax=Actinoplanes derwentensis TaxID=113562 RepID=UPI00194550FE|nr:AfsR/SARP family transcriptional regulator [Actinoplanes derwentensis]
MPVGPPKQRAVLAALAFSVGLPVPVNVLIERVWSDDPPAAARTSVQSYVTRLRKVLRRAAEPNGTARLDRAGDGYRLTVPGPEVDLNRARELSREARARLAGDDFTGAARLAAAGLILWQGEPLAGMTGDWADRVRAGLASERLTLLGAHAHALLGLDRPHDVVEVLAGAVVEYPGAEQLTTQLMIALHRCGRPAEALDAYRRLREHLVGTLGVDPGPEVQRLHRVLLEPDSEPVDHVDKIVEGMRGLIGFYNRQETIAEEQRLQMRRSLENCISAAELLLK